jgi:hypothetical protein
MATLKTIQKELIRLKAAYPYPDRSVDELRTLSDTWMEDFAGVSDIELQAAITAHRRKSEYFPTIAALLAIVDGWRAAEKREREMIPEYTPTMGDETIDRNREQVQKIIRSLESSFTGRMQ